MTYRTCRSAVGLVLLAGCGVIKVCGSDPQFQIWGILRELLIQLLLSPFHKRGNRGWNMGTASPGSHSESMAGSHLETKSEGPEQWALCGPHCAEGEAEAQRGVSLPRSPS